MTEPPHPPTAAGGRRAPWRLIVDPAADGAWNMAVDEAILDCYAAAVDSLAPTLRLYGWSPAALSLGRSQQAFASCDRPFLRREGIDLVRRPTGGRAVLHEWERTYAVIGGLDRAPFDGGVLQVYRRIGGALQAALRRLGLSVRRWPQTGRAPSPRDPASGPSCFDEPGAYEILAAERKVVGSAQLRRKRAFLQHGSILLRSDPARISAALGAPVRGERFSDLDRLLGRPVSADEVDSALVAAWRESFDADLQPGTLTQEETRRATRLRCWKYDSASWTLDGRLGPRERRWGPDLATP